MTGISQHRARVRDTLAEWQDALAQAEMRGERERAQGLRRDIRRLEDDIRRRRDLARIHQLAARLRLDDATYRDMLWSVARVESAGKADAAQRCEIIRHLAALCGAAPKFLRPRIRLAEDRAAMGRKICAMLAHAYRSHAYADEVARRIGGVSRWEFLASTGLHKLIAALEFDKRRHE